MKLLLRIPGVAHVLIGLAMGMVCCLSLLASSIDGLPEQQRTVFGYIGTIGAIGTFAILVGVIRFLLFFALGLTSLAIYPVTSRIRSWFFTNLRGGNNSQATGIAGDNVAPTPPPLPDPQPNLLGTAAQGDNQNESTKHFGVYPAVGAILVGLGMTMVVCLSVLMLRMPGLPELPRMIFSRLEVIGLIGMLWLPVGMFCLLLLFAFRLVIVPALRLVGLWGNKQEQSRLDQSSPSIPTGLTYAKPPPLLPPHNPLATAAVVGERSLSHRIREQNADRPRI
jgi:hypothetical protein